MYPFYWSVHVCCIILKKLHSRFLGMLASQGLINMRANQRKAIMRKHPINTNLANPLFFGPSSFPRPVEEVFQRPPLTSWGLLPIHVSWSPEVQAWRVHQVPVWHPCLLTLLVSAFSWQTYPWSCHASQEDGGHKVHPKVHPYVCAGGTTNIECHPCSSLLRP